SDKWRVTVRGGGANLYRITEQDDEYYVEHEHFRLLGPNDRDVIGKTDSKEDAIELIRSSSGEDIEEINEM
ncbi:MAG: hypothetical protein WCL44_13505, partial [bacterium]